MNIRKLTISYITNDVNLNNIDFLFCLEGLVPDGSVLIKV